jgi:hypothetical protein
MDARPATVAPVSRSLREIRLGVYASDEQLHGLAEAIERLLCPDPEHTPPCPVPWSISTREATAEEYPEVLDQALVEGHEDGGGPSGPGH